MAPMAANIAFCILLIMQVVACNAVRNDTVRCMSQADAQQVVDNYQNLQTQFSNALANVSLSPNFTTYSDATTELINSGCSGPVPLGSATFDSLAAYMAGQGSQPPTPFYQLKLWHTCDHAFVQWRMIATPESVTGIMAVRVVPAPAGAVFPWLIDTVYNEFNSLAYLVYLGAFAPSCTPSNGTQAASRHRKRRELPQIGHIM